MSEMRELIDTELDAVCGGHHGYHGRAELPHPALGHDFTPHGHHWHHGNQGHFDFGNIGDFNFGNIVIQENIAEQVGVAVGSNASVTNLLGGQLNSSSIAGNIGDFNLGNIGNIGNIVNFGNIVIEENIALQVGVAVGSNASVTNLLGGQLNSSSIV
jgi:leucyl aminopeptidase (aminopeptidase T)